MNLMQHFSTPDLYFLITIIVTGAIAAYTAGLFGIGGGVVLVPTFVTIFPYFGAQSNVLMHLAVGTSLALIIPTAISASITQYRMGYLNMKIFLSWLPSVMVGVVIGSFIMHYIPSEWLLVFFSCYLVVCILINVFKKTSATSTEDQVPPKIAQYIGGPIIGMFSVLLGIGGGTFSVPFFSFFNHPLKNSIAISTFTSLFVGFGGTIGAIISGYGLVGRPMFSLGFINLLAFIIITPISIAISPFGSWTANKIPNKILKWVYVTFLTVLAIYMFAKIFYHIP